MNMLDIAPSNTVDVVPVADIAAGTGQFENGLFVFYTSDAPAGKRSSPIVSMARIKIEKSSASDTWAVGEDVEFDVATQKAVATGGVKCGICGEASANGDSFVSVRINE